jgi:hypothetical protein
MDIGSVIAGVFGVAGTLLGKKATAKVTGIDSKIVGAIRPFQPAIALGLGLVLPKVCAAIGVASVCPTGDVLVGAPVGVIGGIVVLEVAKKLGLKL